MCHWHPLMTNGEYLQGTPVWILPQHQHARHWYRYYRQGKCKHLNLKSRHLEVQEKTNFPRIIPQHVLQRKFWS
jgi:hypothetical protein